MMDLEPGAVATFSRTFSQQDYDATAILTGDDNPIHVDPAFAKTTRFGRTLAHGMLLYGTISALIGAEVCGPGTVQLAQQLRFPGPTFTGEEMSIRLELIALDREDGIAEIAAAIRRPNGDLACEGITKVRLPAALSATLRRSA